MKTELFIHPSFSNLREFIHQIPGNFSSMGEEVYNGRNDVRFVNVNGVVLAIKYFKRITLANRYIFATVRKSKARRAYDHAELLIQKGITSPQSVAYINCYRYGMLYQSFYVSLHTNYRPFMEILQLPISYAEPALKAFARFIYGVHKAGIFHKDLTIRNLLYLYNDHRYDFSLIDTNRMSFHTYSFKKGMNNLSRLALPVETIGIIAAEYARQAQVSEIMALNAIVFSRWRTNINLIIKKVLKKPLHLFVPRYRKASYIVTKESTITTDKAFG
ncbi:MAG TPA: lipopolysaccharide kinase InaA family protein [Prolixibacteraceae bacterium]|nr:lipopolysaccharide kinase InaA family protein [Prolixibacteraceae bacterium]